MRLGFGFPLVGEGEHIRDRFLVDPPSDALDPFVGVARTVFSNVLRFRLHSSLCLFIRTPHFLAL
jgi:hypothetical protein